MKLKRFFFVVFLFFSLFITREIQAKEINQFVTIANPVRISYYTKSPRESIKAQYEIIKGNKLPATWLLTFDAISDSGVHSVVKSMDKNQEIGIFLEVTPKFAKEAKLAYHDTGSWHFANSVFLSGYTQEERKILIDKIFDVFKKKFGYYPTSVGSWWTDSFSLSYMRDKYGVVANLGVADQFSTDGYQIWGSYWSTPYYPSRYHLGIPAPTEETKLDVVNLEWAARDPLNGYKSSLYSTQDYFTVPERLGTPYFEELVNLYAKRGKNSFGQITVGLEADFTPDAYDKEFKRQMNVIKKLSDSGEFSVTNMRDFSVWYRNTFKKISPSHLIETEDLLDKSNKIIWYQSPNYRIGLVFNEKSKKTKIFDLRSYHPDLVEPYYVSPNGDRVLSIYVPSYLDEIQDRENIWELNLEPRDIEFSPEKIIIEKKVANIPRIIRLSPTLRVNTFTDRVEIVPEKEWLTGREGYVFTDFSVESIHYLKSPKELIKLLIKRDWNKIRREKYFVSQGEVDALFHLSTFAQGKVLVYDGECLQCSWHTEGKPAIFANIRNYVEKFSKHPTTKNQKVFSAKTREESRKEFVKNGAKYIYLVKFENYREDIPFSPGDLGVEKVYENANAQIWEVKK